MTGSREHVLATLDHREPDRVPLTLGGTASSFTDEAYFRLRGYLGIHGDVKPYRYGHTGCYYDDRILEALGTDYRYLVLTYPDDSHLKVLPDGSFLDEWGIRKQNVDGYVSRVGEPLAGATLEDLKRYPWPDPTLSDFHSLHTGCETGPSIFTRKWTPRLWPVLPCPPRSSNGAWLCGYEEFLMRLKSDKPFAAKLIEKILNVQLALYDVLLDGVGEYVDIVETAEDYGTQASLLISAATYREMIMPARQRLNAFIKSKAPHAKILHHTCGAVGRLIPDLWASGIDILNPIQPLATGMESATLKGQWGDRLCFDGGIDTQFALPGNLAGLEVEVRGGCWRWRLAVGTAWDRRTTSRATFRPATWSAYTSLAHDLARYPLDTVRLQSICQTRNRQSHRVQEPPAMSGSADCQSRRRRRARRSSRSGHLPFAARMSSASTPAMRKPTR